MVQPVYPPNVTTQPGSGAGQSDEDVNIAALQAALTALTNLMKVVGAVGINLVPLPSGIVAAPATGYTLYIDLADGGLKAISANGTVKTISLL